MGLLRFDKSLDIMTVEIKCSILFSSNLSNWCKSYPDFFTNNSSSIVWGGLLSPVVQLNTGIHDSSFLFFSFRL